MCTPRLSTRPVLDKLGLLVLLMTLVRLRDELTTPRGRRSGRPCCPLNKETPTKKPVARKKPAGIPGMAVFKVDHALCMHRPRSLLLSCNHKRPGPKTKSMPNHDIGGIARHGQTKTLKIGGNSVSARCSVNTVIVRSIHTERGVKGVFPLQSVCLSPWLSAEFWPFD